MSASESTSRESLLQVIGLVKPALASQSFIAALTHICFNDGSATTYNDIAAISVRTVLDLQACIPGEMLSKALSSLSAAEVMISPSEAGIVVTAGRSKLKIPTLPTADFPLPNDLINERSTVSVALDDEILRGIELCLTSVSGDPNHPAQMGVTLCPGNPGILFSTDNFTLSRYKLNHKVSLPAEAPIVLPTFFCQQLITMRKAFPNEEVVLEVKFGAVVAYFGSQAWLCNKMVVDLEPLDFQRIIDRYSIDEKLANRIIPIPDEFDSSFGRALLVLSMKQDKVTRVTLSGKRMALYSESEYGTAEDSMAVPEPVGELDPFFIDPELVVRASKLCSNLATFEKVMVLTNSDNSFTHLIAHCSAR